MPSLADALGFGPSRTEVIQEDGSMIVTVTPPKHLFPNARPKRLELSPSQVEGYKKWKSGGLIQECLPDLPAAAREYLMSGLDLETEMD